MPGKPTPAPANPPRRARTAPITVEHELLAAGRVPVVGLDEAGYGALAGPVVVGAVCLPWGGPAEAAMLVALRGVKDSKQMTARQRASLVEQVRGHALAVGLGEASASEVDGLGVAPARLLAMRRAFDALAGALGSAPLWALTDSVKWAGATAPLPPERVLAMVRGDQRSLSIAAASVLAKTHRDALMTALHDRQPAYAFARHKGYGTAQHLTLLRQHRPLAGVHRHSYSPVQQAARQWALPLPPPQEGTP